MTGLSTSAAARSVPSARGVLVLPGDEALVVYVVVADEVVSQRLRDGLFQHARGPVGGLERLAGEVVDARLARAGRQRLDDLL